MKRFLIVKPSSLGDIIHAMPAVSALSRAVPEAKIDWIVKPEFQGLPLALPCVDRVILFHRERFRNLFRFFSELKKLKQDIRTVHYDAVIDLQGLWRSGAIAHLADADVCAGSGAPRESSAVRFYSRTLDVPLKRSEVHAVEFNNALMAAFLGTTTKKLDFSVELRRDPYALSKVRDLFEDEFGNSIPDDYFVVAPGARWETKRWPVSFFVEVIRELHKLFPEIPVLLIGSAEDIPLCEQIEANTSGIPVASIAGRTDMLMLIEVIRGATAMICNDSGPMHMAAVLNIPVAAMFGPTDSNLTGPYSAKSHVFMPENLECVRCFKHTCSHCTCHTAIDPVKVANTVHSLLADSLVSQVDSF